jgi:hydrogenase/urease accessory protein HupE
MKRGLSRLCAVWFLVLGASCMRVAHAHEFKLDMVINAFVQVEPGDMQMVVRAPLYLFKSVRFPVTGAEIDVDQAAPAVQQALAAFQQSITLYENGRPLAASQATGRLSLPSDRSFDSYDQATRHVAEPLDPGTRLYDGQGYVDARFSFPINSQDAEFSIRSTAAPELGESLKVALRFAAPGHESRAFVITSNSGTVALDPTWSHAAFGFVRLGITHILTGYDHLLFLLCLMIPLRGWRQILSVITVFTVAHSFTLLGSAFDLTPSGRWFPPFVEMAIAASIVYMALENIMGVRLERRVLITGLFGLIHGFGFSYGLQENFQFAGSHLLVSLFGFNVGIELGQMMALAVMLPALVVLRRYVLPGRTGMIILSAIIADTGWHWMLDRADVLWQTPWPRPDTGQLATLAFWVAGLLLAAAGLRSLAKRIGLSTGSRLPSTEGMQSE